MDAMTPSSWVHCGREFSAREVADICATVAWLPGLARHELAATLCEHLGWVTLTGTAKTGACLEFLQRLQAAGLLVLPAQRAARVSRSTPRCPARPRAVAEPMVEPTPVEVSLSALAPVRLEVIRDTALAKQWDDLMARWHPLGFQGAFGYRLRYFITAGELRLGCVLLSGAARAVAVRDDCSSSHFKPTQGGGWRRLAHEDCRAWAVKIEGNSGFLKIMLVNSTLWC